MFGKLVDQQKILLPAQIWSQKYFYLIAGLIGLSNWGKLSNGSLAAFYKYQVVFSRTEFALSIFTLIIICSVSSADFRFSDIYLLKDRKIITWQLFINSLVVPTLFLFFWGLTKFIVLIISGQHGALANLASLFLLGSIYVWLVGILLGVAGIFLYVQFKSKLLAILIVFTINFFDYVINLKNHQTLLYYFAAPLTQHDILFRLFALVILIVMLLVLTHRALLRREL